MHLRTDVWLAFQLQLGPLKMSAKPPHLQPRVPPGRSKVGCKHLQLPRANFSGQISQIGFSYPDLQAVLSTVSQSVLLFLESLYLRVATLLCK